MFARVHGFEPSPHSNKNINNNDAINGLNMGLFEHRGHLRMTQFQLNKICWHFMWATPFSDRHVCKHNMIAKVCQYNICKSYVKGKYLRTSCFAGYINCDWTLQWCCFLIVENLKVLVVGSNNSSFLLFVVTSILQRLPGTSDWRGSPNSDNNSSHGRFVFFSMFRHIYVFVVRQKKT